MKRIFWIDNLKGILLFLICLSHYSNLYYPVQYLTIPTASYWVPMFFVLSGYLYQEGRSFKSYLNKKNRTLLIPYFFFSFIFLIIDPNTYKGITELSENLYNICIVGSGPNKAQPLWFVWVLYGSSITSFFILEHIRNNFIKALSILTISCFSLLLSTYKINCILHIDLILSATIFFICGYFGKKLIGQSSHPHVIAILAGTIGCFGFWIDLGDFHFNQITNYPLFYICPISLILFLSVYLKHLKEISPLSWIAKNGIVILSSHCYLIFTYDFILRKYNINFISIVNFLIQTIFVFGVLYLIVIPIINKYGYWGIGKTKNK